MADLDEDFPHTVVEVLRSGGYTNCIRLDSTKRNIIVLIIREVNISAKK